MSRLLRFLPVLLVLPLAACLGPRPATAPAAAQDVLLPDLFFLGQTRGLGTLTVRGGVMPEVVRVESTGRRNADGTFRLDQTVAREGGTARRTWQMRRTGERTYAATLTDAAGPVTATVDGATLTIRYRMTGWGVRMHQTLTLLPGGTDVQNEATVSWLGVPLAYLSERITRLGGPM